MRGIEHDEAVAATGPRLVQELDQLREVTQVLETTVSQLEKRLAHVTWRDKLSKEDMDSKGQAPPGSETTARLVECRRSVADSVQRIVDLVNTLDV